MRALVLTMILLFWSSACASSRASLEATIAVQVADDHGRALGGVAIALDDTPVAVTDASGRASAVVQSRISTRVRLQARCPDDYRPLEARQLALSQRDQATGTLQLRFTCIPKLRSLAVVVRAPGAEGLALRVDGVPVAKIQPDGTSHLVLKRAADTTLRLSLDTSAAPTLHPQFPVREVLVGDRDEIIVFDQALVARALVTKPRAVRHRATAGPSRHVPYAIGRSD